MQDYNNFHCYLPGGLYRKKDFFQKEISNHTIGQNLDKLIDELNFDTQKFYRLKEESIYLLELGVEIQKKVMEEKRECTKDEQKIIDDASLTQKSLNVKITRMLKPLYVKMRSLGYSERDLTE